MTEITYNGETKTIQQWSKQFGIDQGTARSRLLAGWPLDKVFATGRHYSGCGLTIEKEKLEDFYMRQKMSIPQISKLTSIPKSSVRGFLIQFSIPIRTHAEGTRLRTDVLGQHRKGKKFVFSDEHKLNISKARKKRPCRGWRITPTGYKEFTTGPNDERSEHVVAMEAHIGRKINPGEHVHHINENKLDNRIENLRLMTRSEHASLHRKLEQQRKAKNAVV